MKNNSYKTMTRALIRAALVIALVTAAVFLLIRLVPGDPVVMVLGEHATDEAVNQLREHCIRGVQSTECCVTCNSFSFFCKTYFYMQIRAIQLNMAYRAAV